MLPRPIARWDRLSQAQYLEASHAAARLHPVVAGRSGGDGAWRSRGVFRSSITAWWSSPAALPPRLKMRVLEREVSAEARRSGLIPESCGDARSSPTARPRPEASSAHRRSPASDYVDDLLSASRLRGRWVFQAAGGAAAGRKARAGQVVGVQRQHGPRRQSCRRNCSCTGSCGNFNGHAHARPIIHDIRTFVIENFLFGQQRPDFSNAESFLESGIIDSTGVLELVGFLEDATASRSPITS